MIGFVLDFVIITIKRNKFHEIVFDIFTSLKLLNQI